MHHFGGFHHGGHHGLGHFYDDFHFYPFFGLGFYGWSYPYYYDYYHRPYYYDYYPYPSYSTSYYESPVHDSTNYPPANAAYDTGATAGSYRTQTEASDNPRTRFPDVFLPRMELPSREAPEALPAEPTPEQRQLDDPK